MFAKSMSNHVKVLSMIFAILRVLALNLNPQHHLLLRRGNLFLHSFCFIFLKLDFCPLYLCTSFFLNLNMCFHKLLSVFVDFHDITIIILKPNSEKGNNKGCYLPAG